MLLRLASNPAQNNSIQATLVGRKTYIGLGGSESTSAERPLGSSAKTKLMLLFVPPALLITTRLMMGSPTYLEIEVLGTKDI